MAYKQFTPDVLSSADVNTYLMKQSVVTFADATTRTNTLGTPIPEGMVTYLKDVDELEVYNGTAWLRVGVTSDDDSLSIAGNVNANTGKFVANRSSATSGNNAGGLDMQIDGTAYGQIFMNDSNTMRFTANTHSFDGSIKNVQQPFVLYSGIPYGSAYPVGSQILKWPTSVYSYGVGAYGYSASTGLFYAPVTGFYLCHANLGTYSSGLQYAYWRVYIRNSSGTELASNLSNISYIATGTHDFLTLTYVHYMVAGDYCYFTGDTATSSLSYYGTQFCMFRLLG